MHDNYVTAKELKEKRDKRAIPHLEQYAPVWITDEVYFLEEEAVQFHAVFFHPVHQWVSRRYRYDGFNNTLYHKGQTLLDEEEALEITLGEPYITPSVADLPNSYGG